MSNYSQKEIVEVIETNESSNPRKFTIANNKLFFEATNNSFQEGIWVSDGTKNSTFNIAIANLQAESFGDIIVVDDKIFFPTVPGRATGGVTSVSDGTSENTFAIDNLFSPIARPNFITVLNNKLFLGLNKSDTGEELWISDGTEDGSFLVKDINTGSDSSNPIKVGNSDNQLYFSADNGDIGNELWITDGTNNGTFLIKDIHPGSNSSYPQGGVVLNNKLFFSADDGELGRELWISDGTEAGTSLVKDINPGTNSSQPQDYFVFKNRVLFTAENGESGRELWVTDGTENGT
ncbi:MAG: hypothetical protein MJK14_05710, partial [Rivularia sp. ALOHA_DT_140]|nr:hypothetical protein [Rivularia sp. ALOHA_DT_140]